MDDDFSAVRIGDWVQLTEATLEDDLGDGPVVSAEQGDVGDVTYNVRGNCPTVHWHRTGLYRDCHPDDFHVLCDADFASCPETTPLRPRRDFVRRGVS